MATTLEKKHPLAIRWFHWINFPVLSIMVWSGILIYWANHIYTVTVGGHTLFTFFPDAFFKRFDLEFRLAEGMGWHFLFGWFFAINGLLYVLYLLFSGEWRVLLPVPADLKNSLLVVLHDLRLRKEAPPQGKYNAAQKIAYTGVVLLGIVELLTGLAIYKPTQLAFITSFFGGYTVARWIHFWVMILLVAFFGVHVAQVIKAGWNNFRSMVVGWEIKRG